jgi:hypothetical protein
MHLRYVEYLKAQKIILYQQIGLNPLTWVLVLVHTLAPLHSLMLLLLVLQE